MAQKPTGTVSTIGSQRDYRYTDTFYDQHKSVRFGDGRPWWGEREQAANRGEKDGFLANLMPGDHRDPIASVWEAPWYPECRFFDYSYARGRITIRYDKMIGEDKRATDDYYAAANKLAYEKAWQDVEYGTLPRWQVRAVIGEPPRSPRIAEAAQAGDPWLLGFAVEPNAELERLLRQSRGEFSQVPRGQTQAVLESDATDIAALIERAVSQALTAREDEIRARVESEGRGKKLTKAAAGAL